MKYTKTVVTRKVEDVEVTNENVYEYLRFCLKGDTNSYLEPFHTLKAAAFRGLCTVADYEGEAKECLDKFGLELVVKESS